MLYINYGNINFNPRSPWGERLLTRLVPMVMLLFQSTLPVGGATPIYKAEIYASSISIHAPRGGSDLLRLKRKRISTNFNPRSPWGERLQNTEVTEIPSLISIHAPRGGSDC